MALICRLCLNSNSDHYDANQDVEKYFQAVLPEIDLSLVESPTFCHSCIDLLKTSYSFKNNCLETEKILKLYILNNGGEKVLLENVVQKHIKTELKNPIKVELDNTLDSDMIAEDIGNYSDFNIKIDETAIETKEYDEGPNKEEVEEDYNKQYKCKICFDKVYRLKKDLWEHIRAHFTKNMCNICKKDLYNTGSLKRHLYNVHQVDLTDDRWRSDTIIEIDGAALEQSLREHNLLENVEAEDKFERKFNCALCPRRYTSTPSLKRHLRIAHEVNTSTKERRADFVAISVVNFKCHICEKDYHHKKDVIEHIRTHFSKFYCKLCTRRFFNMSTVKRHLRHVHRLNLDDSGCQSKTKFEVDKIGLEKALKLHNYENICESSNNISDDKDINDQDDEMSNSVNLKNEANQLACSICKHIYYRKKDLMEHVKTHFTKANCKLCEKQLYNIATLKRHLQNVHMKDVSGVRWRSDALIEVDEQSLEKCLEQYNEPSKYTCVVCWKQFGSRWSFGRHKLIHSSKKTSCEFCEKTFVTIERLNKHITMCHLGRKQRKRSNNFVCETCGHRTSSRGALKHHENTHTGLRPYKCDQCDKAFAQGSTLWTHKQIVHSTERLFTCEYCSRSFKIKGSLTKHILDLHLADKIEKKFICNYCGKKYRLQSQLKRHLTWHKPEIRPYSCDVCNKTFISKHSVKKHRIIHFPEKPHKCEICGKGFHHKYNIKIHMKVHGLVS